MNDPHTPLEIWAWPLRIPLARAIGIKCCSQINGQLLMLSAYQHIARQFTHWLRGAEYIKFKLAILTFRFLHDTAPATCLLIFAVAGVPSRQRLHSSPWCVHPTRLYRWRSGVSDWSSKTVAWASWRITAALSLTAFRRQPKLFCPIIHFRIFCNFSSLLEMANYDIKH
jgi:hypothetical protein